MFIKYVFQTTIHRIWRERNDRRHGEKPTPMHRLIQHIDKQVRNRLSSIEGIAPDLEGALEKWFEAKSSS